MSGPSGARGDTPEARSARDSEARYARKAMMRAHMLALAGLAAMAAPAAAETIAITGATIYQRSDRKLDNATIVLRDGRIADVGPGVAVPAGATQIDGK